MLSLEWLLPSCSELKTSKFIKDKVDTYGLISVKNLVVEAVLRRIVGREASPCVKLPCHWPNLGGRSMELDRVSG